MGRRVVTVQLMGPINAPVDTYFDKVVKYIPADIIAAWVTVVGLVKGAAGVNVQMVMWIAFAVGVILTPLWTWKQTSLAGAPPVKRQIAIATAAFVVWTIALNSPPFDGFTPLYGSLLLIAYTLVVGLIDPH
ncbi:hypothetical protein GR197_05015 [Rhizobium phaseoli]|uniref:Uncharacterized protein n=1 Tax=Rhizobium phaseoli TaxID=396 RepID=A0A7K3U9R0_9HYPH|nr:hypothetical protein [Rhizobium phaseoli]NEJ69899.1 hypothetical protein [Rhizobium phaseoli]